MQTTIQKWGNSQGIRIPKSIMDFLGMKVNDKVEIIQRDNDIVLKRAETETTLDSIFEGYNGDYPEAYDWGETKGSEIW